MKKEKEKEHAWRHQGRKPPMFVEWGGKSKGRKVQDNIGEMDISQVMMGLMVYGNDLRALF